MIAPTTICIARRNSGGIAIFDCPIVSRSSIKLIIVKTPQRISIIRSRFSRVAEKSHHRRTPGIKIRSIIKILTQIPYGAGGRPCSDLYFSGLSSIAYFRNKKDTLLTIRGETIRDAMKIPMSIKKGGILLNIENFL